MLTDISRRALLAAGAATAAVGAVNTSVLSPALAQGALAPVTDTVKAIHARLIAIDPHLDVPFDYGVGTHDPRVDGDTQFDLPKAKRGGLGAVALAAFVPPGPLTPDGYAKAANQLALKLKIIHAIADNNPDQVEIALSPDDVVRIHKAGKLALIVSFLNAYSLGDDVGKIDDLYRQGVRIFGPVWVGNNLFADSDRPTAGPGLSNGGLSSIGYRALKRVNDLGILFDISQLSKAAVLQTLKASRAPVIASHSGVWGLVRHPRNLSDEELDALKTNGGVIALNAFPSYLKAVPAADIPKVVAVRTQYGLSAVYGYPQEGSGALANDKRAGFSQALNAVIPPANVSDLIDSVDYAVKRIGIDHVAVSTDFNHGGGIIGWANEGEAINVTAELVKRGYAEADIRKIWGQNILRVWRAAQDGAQKA